MQRFYVTFPLSIDMSITDDAMIHQLTRVLRVEIGEHIILFAGDVMEIEYEIVAIDKRQIRLRGVSQKSPNTEPKRKVSLYQALPNKYEKIEYIIQKGVEIGIQRFVFFRSVHSQKLIITPSKEERFEAIAREALEQCGGLVMPEIYFLDGFPTEALYRIPTDVSGSHLVLDTIGTNTRMNVYMDVSDISLWVGPEGGWSDSERSLMTEKGFIFARFGERILRTETAGIVIGFGFMNG